MSSDDHGDGASQQRLERELAEVERRIVALSEEFDEIVAGSELVNTDDEHDPDGATIAFERAQVAALRDAALRQRTALLAALEAVEAGAYGRCERCGGPIGEERLDAVPGTTRCVACALTI